MRTEAALRSRQSNNINNDDDDDNNNDNSSNNNTKTPSPFTTAKVSPIITQVLIVLHRNVGTVLKLSVCCSYQRSQQGDPTTPHPTAQHTAPHLGQGEVTLSILGRRDEPARYVHPLARPAHERLPRHLAPQLLKLLAKEFYPWTCQRMNNDSSTRRRA